MTQHAMVFPGGDSKEIRFEDMRVTCRWTKACSLAGQATSAVAVDLTPTCSVVIAGGGPAGSTAATMLRKLGHRRRPARENPASPISYR